MSAAAKILDRLDKVKSTGPGRWLAKCPAHEDRSPSLSIRELDDGRVLLHCFAGCEIGDVLDALGLELADLFERPIAHHLPRSRSKIRAVELLELIDGEALAVGMIALQFRDTGQLSQEDWQRLSTAIARIGGARDHAAPLRIDPRKTVYPRYAR